MNGLSEYFHKKNNGSTNFNFYVVYQGHRTKIFKTWEEVLPNISNHPRPSFKGIYDLSQALDQCKTNIGNNYFISPLVKKILIHQGNNYLNFAQPSQTCQTPNLVHDFPPLFPLLPFEDHLLREELEILRKNMIILNKIIRL